MKVGNEPANGHSHYLKGEKMADTKKVAELSAEATSVLEALRNSDTPLTLAQLKEVVPNANSAHLTALRTRNLVEANEVEVVVKTTRKVLAYHVKAE